MENTRNPEIKKEAPIDTARGRIPKSERRSLGSMLFLWFGAVLVVSSMLAGGTIGDMFPMKMVLPVLLFGELMNVIFATGTGVIASRTGFSTAMITTRVYGLKGAILPNMVAGVTAIGWYGIVNGTIASSGVSFFGAESGGALWYVLAIVFSFLFALTAIKSMKAMEILDYIAVPLVIIMIAIITFQSVKVGGGLSQIIAEDFTPTVSLNAGLSAAVGSWAVGAILCPDVMRYAKSGKHVFITAVIGFILVALPEKLAAALGTSVTGQADLTLVMAQFGYVALGFFCMLFASWSTQQINAYNVGTCFSAPPMPLIKKDGEKTRVLWVFLGAVLSCLALVLGIANSFASFLEFIGNLVPPLFGVIFTDYWILKNKKKYYVDEDVPEVSWNAIFSTLAGVVVSLVTARIGVGVSAINGLVFTGVMYAVWDIAAKKRA